MIIGPRTPRELVAWPEMRRSATFSPCGRYRYRLSRRWGPGPCALFVCHNPSVAGKRLDPADEDTELDDRTAIRMMTFTWFWGYDALLVGNLYGYVSTDPDNMVGVRDPIGPENDVHLAAMLAESDLTVAGWGASRIASGQRIEDVTRLLVLRRDVHAIRVTGGGYPTHPLARGKGRIPDESWPELYRPRCA